ncbi:MAG: cell division protein FtsA [bacterium]|nr:cell division protein FtsA [bacterium]
MRDTIVGIDIGTTKICTVVGNVDRDEGLMITGIGRVPSRGLRKGKVCDLERTISSIRESKMQAEAISNSEILSAYVSVTGAHIHAEHSNAIVAVTDPQRGITLEDAENALEQAQHIDIPNGRRLIDVQVREYIVDGQVGISDPVGMTGMRLEVNVLLVTADISHLENIYRAVNHAGIDVDNLIVEPVASAEAVLSQEERESGVAIVDIGGGTTDLAVYRDGVLDHLDIFPVGGDHFDSDLSYGIGVTTRQAEHLKIKLGGIGREYVASEDIIEITKSGDRKETIPLKIIPEIIYPRMEEIFSLIHDSLQRGGYLKKLPSGLVITGGTSLLPGITEMASEVFGVQARIGYPRDIGGLSEESRSPIYSTSIGLVKIGAMDLAEKTPSGIPSGMNKILERADSIWKKTLKIILR